MVADTAPPTGSTVDPSEASPAEALMEFLGGFFDDEGSKFALDLMQHYVTGNGARFVRGASNQLDLLGWSDFMIGRPEIQAAMEEYFGQWAATIGEVEKAPHGQFAERLKHTPSGEAIRLYDLASMRLTLHGCHEIVTYGRWHRMLAEGTIYSYQRPLPDQYCYYPDPPKGLRVCPSVEPTHEITFYDVHFIWVDRGDLHGGLSTILKSGKSVSDEAFEALNIGKPYDIEIHFKMPGMSIWRYSWDLVLEQLHGWPPKNPGF